MTRKKSPAKQKTLLVTGGAGFIGINTVRHFLKKGWKVVIFDNFSRRGTDINVKNLKRDFRSGYRVVRGDIVHDASLLEKCIARADAVIHLAAQVAVTTSIADPKEDLEINIIGTFNVLEAIRHSKKKPMLIYASTNKVYGSLPQLPVRESGARYRFKHQGADRYGIAEDVALDFHSPYGCSKGAADQYVLDYGRIYGIDAVVFRQSCVYGEHQFGVEDQGWVAWFAIAALKGAPLTLYGTGKQVRDVLYIGDLMRLYETALANMRTARGQAYNIGGGPGNTISLIEFLAHLDKTHGKKTQYSISAERAGDQPIFVADVRKVGRDLGWQPTTAFANGFKRLYRWVIEHEEAIKRI